MLEKLKRVDKTNLFVCKEYKEGLYDHRTEYLSLYAFSQIIGIPGTRKLHSKRNNVRGVRDSMDNLVQLILYFSYAEFRR
jgi:hypothetical protein